MKMKDLSFLLLIQLQKRQLLKS